MKFSFAAPGVLRFGRGAAGDDAATEITRLGTNVFMTTGATPSSSLMIASTRPRIPESTIPLSVQINGFSQPSILMRFAISL